MTLKVCNLCKLPFEDHDLVSATVICRFRAIPSEVNISLSLPTECVALEHVQCADPQGEFEYVEEGD